MMYHGLALSLALIFFFGCGGSSGLKSPERQMEELKAAVETPSPRFRRRGGRRRGGGGGGGGGGSSNDPLYQRMVDKFREISRLMAEGRYEEASELSRDEDFTELSRLLEAENYEEASELLTDFFNNL